MLYNKNESKIYKYYNKVIFCIIVLIFDGYKNSRCLMVFFLRESLIRNVKMVWKSVINFFRDFGG